MSRRALFLDRDGIVDDLVYYPSHDEWEAPRSLADLTMIDGILDPLQQLVDAGWLLFLVTNQPSFRKGKAELRALLKVQRHVAARLPVARAYACFHRSEDRCICRKPSPYFLQLAAREFNVDLSASWMIGDQDSDLLCGRNAGCKVALLEHRGSAHKRGKVEPDLKVNSVAELVSALIPTSSASS